MVSHKRTKRDLSYDFLSIYPLNAEERSKDV